MENNNNEYFIPEIEDMSIGCEFEMDDTWGGWRKLTLTKELLANPMVGLGSGNERSPWYHKIRVPYLTKKQIEAEGWISQSETGFFTKDKYELYYNQQWNNDKEFSLQILDQPNFLYQGECKDINTFRKLIKLLSIE
jgi:hypothetical protein